MDQEDELITFPMRLNKRSDERLVVDEGLK